MNRQSCPFPKVILRDNGRKLPRTSFNIQAGIYQLMDELAGMSGTTQCYLIAQQLLEKYEEIEHER